MEKRQGIYMHHDILLLVPGMEVDHIDGNRLNNKKSNLRLVEHVDNMRNANTLKSRVGVCFNQRAKLWMAYIDEFDKKRVYLGYRRTREEALRLVEIAKCS
jgi:hypothetical protein